MKLRTGTALILMICMIVFSVGFGAYRGWSRDRAEVEKAYESLNELVASPNARLEEILFPRIEAANALLTVAKRHLPDSDETVTALKQDRDALAGSTTLKEKTEANGQMIRHAEALLDRLAAQESVRSDGRDLAYASQPGYLRTLLKNSEAQASEDQFTQAVGDFEKAVDEYNQAADGYNSELQGSFSGWIARLLGVKTVERFTDPMEARFSVPSKPRYPQKPTGHVADVTMMGVLDAKTTADLETLAERTQKATGGSIYVAAVDFLNQTNADEYARTLFEQWGLKDRDALLLMAVGDGHRSLALGSALRASLDQTALDRLFGRSFDSLYAAQQYSQAAAGLIQAGAKELSPATDVSGLFSTFSDATPAPTQKPQASAGTNADFVKSILTSVREMSESKASSHHFDWRSILIWGLVIYFLFFRKKKRKRR